VEAIYVTGERDGTPAATDEVAVIEGLGLDGDRYAKGEGSWFKPGKAGQHVTLIEAEVIEAVNAAGITIDPGRTRRNIVTRGVGLDSLIGRTFRLGTATLVGVRDCPPCTHLEAGTTPGIKDALENKGGLRADVVESGRVRVGDPILTLEAAVVDSVR